MRKVNYEIVINEHGIEISIIVEPYTEEDKIELIKKFNQLIVDISEV